MLSESELAERVAGLFKHAFLAALDDPELRPRLRSLALEVLAATEPEQAEQGPAPETGKTEEAGEMHRDAAPEGPPPSLDPSVAEAVKSLEIGKTLPASPPEDQAAQAPGVHGVADADLPMIEARCKLKAKGAHWAAQRRKLLAGGADFELDIEPKDREIITEARKLPDCFLWMNHPDGPVPPNDACLEELAGCFETTADAMALVRGVLSESEGCQGDDAGLEEALGLLAEAGSALRVAVRRTGYDFDRDQKQAYGWLRGACWKHQIYIHRHMRIDDPADPGNWPSLWERIQSLDAQVQERIRSRKQYESGLKRIRYHAKKILGDRADDHAHDWGVILETADKIVAGGIPPSSTELRELLLPLVDDIPDDLDLPQNVQLVIREIDRYLASRPPPRAESKDAGPTEDVRLVAGWLRGRSAVLIGGDARPHSKEALEKAFGLAELDWVETRSPQSISSFETNVARENVALVMLAIRWSSHSYGEVREFCERYGKPLVRLPGGYNPNQVAAQIIAQCSGQFENPAGEEGL